MKDIMYNMEYLQYGLAILVVIFVAALCRLICLDLMGRFENIYTHYWDDLHRLGRVDFWFHVIGIMAGIMIVITLISVIFYL